MHRFSTPGIYYYWSDWLAEDFLTTLREVIYVKEAESTTKIVHVSVSGHEAEYNVSSGLFLLICLRNLL